jgi:class 3 adenylate cyclase
VVAFDGPARAIRAGRAILAAAERSGAAASAGLHTGECVRREDRVEGAAIDVAAAIGQQAGTGELLISRTVKDLVAGAAFQFIERGRHPMPLDEGEWRLYAVDSSADPGRLQPSI